MTEKSALPLVMDAGDFQAITVAAKLKNLTSGTNECGPAGIDLLELGEHQLTFSTPKAFCSMGHQIAVVLVVKAPKLKKVMEFALRATAKVVMAEAGNHEGDSVTLRLIQYQEEDWIEFEKTFTGRQGEILEFFRSVKGQE